MFDPLRVQEIRKEIELRAPVVVMPSNDDAGEDADSKVPAPRIINPGVDENIAANADDAVIIQGTADQNTKQIKIKTDLLEAFYTLNKYQPGDTTWRYIVSKEFGSLKHGANTVRVYGIDNNGNETERSVRNFTYEGAKGDVITASTPPAVVTPNINLGGDYARPTITNPPNSPFQTAAEVVTITGTVDLGTQSVEVNGFRLTKFTPGDTAFKYIANANYDNMAEGENVYEIVSTSDDGQRTQSNVTVIYTPLNVAPAVEETAPETTEE